MRVVLKINGATAIGESVQKLISAVGRLLADDHRVVIIAADSAGHTGRKVREAFSLPFIGKESANGWNMARRGLLVTESRLLASFLSRAGVPGMALCGTDVNICRLRRRYDHTHKNAFAVEISSVDPRWIELFCSHGGVPVISNWVMEAPGEFYLSDSDQMASACAICWNADALIYLTDSKGITNAEGTVMRWLDVTDVDHRQGFGSGHIHDSIVNGCKRALQKGVRRARILPVESLDSLPLFYFARIQQGTEVVLMHRTVTRQLLPSSQSSSV